MKMGDLSGRQGKKRLDGVVREKTKRGSLWSRPRPSKFFTHSKKLLNHYFISPLGTHVSSKHVCTSTCVYLYVYKN